MPDIGPNRAPAPKKTVDPNHPNVQSLNKAGLSTARLNELINTDVTSALNHEAISQTPTPTTPSTLPAPGFNFTPGSMAYTFEQMLSQLVPPTVPNEPQVANATPGPIPQSVQAQGQAG
jgi:hypothetical protein